MSDLVKRLREDFRGCPFPSVYTTCNEAADEIERLRAEKAKLRMHAENFVKCRIRANGYTDWSKEMLDDVFEAYRADFPKETDHDK